jgi:hypothetical protein
LSVAILVGSLVILAPAALANELTDASSAQIVALESRQPILCITTSGESATRSTAETVATARDTAPGSLVGASRSSKNVWCQRTYYTYLGFYLCSYRMEKYFEYNGKRVSNITVSTSGHLASGQSATGWHYDGTVESGGDYYMWGGSVNGAHYSCRQGSFTQTLYGLQIAQYLPRLKIWVRANGSWDHSISG